MPHIYRTHGMWTDTFPQWVDCFNTEAGSEHNMPSGDKCPNSGHRFYGKFDHCLAETIHQWSMEGADDEGGDTDGPGYFALLLDCDTYDLPAPEPAYIVQNHSNGAVTVHRYDTNEAAQSEWDNHIEPLLNEWHSFLESEGI